MVLIINSEYTYTLRIADLYFNVATFKDDYTNTMFKDYMVSEKSDGAYNVVCVLTEDPLLEPLGTKLTNREDANWYLTDGVYSLCFYDDENNCICAKMSFDKVNFAFDVQLLDVAKLYGVDTEFFLYNILERVFRIALVFNNGFAIHASSIVHEGYGLAFSAESGTGKSTHTDLWMKTFPGTYILNDDAPAFRLINGEWCMYGTPWAGTTGINVNVGVPLKALVFLERSETNTIRDASTLETIRRLFEAIIHPMSDEITDIVFTSVSSFIANARVCVLGCNISEEAPKTVKNYLF